MQKKTISVIRVNGKLAYMSNYTGEFVWWHEVRGLLSMISDMRKY